ncbi:hypothetical protein CDAR_46431 [Caerostris darwini]|uniref:Uncharacterized protein n=1 Tax=Caerostris darwini TaxID=1538125 RepID=A0AAV4S3J0_9ARAC|nr:hypothetical protein CDAR_46431 [Caerostris darwini]
MFEDYSRKEFLQEAIQETKESFGFRELGAGKHCQQSVSSDCEDNLTEIVNHSLLQRRGGKQIARVLGEHLLFSFFAGVSFYAARLDYRSTDCILYMYESFKFITSGRNIRLAFIYVK